MKLALARCNFGFTQNIILHEAHTLNIILRLSVIYEWPLYAMEYKFAEISISQYMATVPQLLTGHIIPTWNIIEQRWALFTTRQQRFLCPH